MKRNNLLVVLLMASLRLAHAEDAVDQTDSTTGGGLDSPMIEMVDVPMAEVLDAGTYAATFRFYSQGGLVSRLLIAPLRRVTMGLSFDAQRVIGGGDPNAVTPDIYFKLRAFDGNDYLPALAIGYDSQGMLYQRPAKEFMHAEKGVYIVGGHEIFLPNMEIHAGMNVPVPHADDTNLYGFMGLSWRFVPNFSYLMEYDNIRNGPTNRFNIGGRFFVTPFFNIDVAARNIGRKSDRGAERIVRLNYVARFPF